MKTVNKLNDNKSKKIVALKNKIDQMNKKIKLAEKPSPRMTRRTKSGNVNKADSRDNLKEVVPTKCRSAKATASSKQPLDKAKKSRKIIPKSTKSNEAKQEVTKSKLPKIAVTSKVTKADKKSVRSVA